MLFCGRHFETGDYIVLKCLKHITNGKIQYTSTPNFIEVLFLKTPTDRYADKTTHFKPTHFTNSFVSRHFFRISFNLEQLIATLSFKPIFCLNLLFDFNYF